MSVIPLSQREGYMQTVSGEDAPAVEIDTGEKLDAIISSNLDPLIDSATDTIVNRGKPDDSKFGVLLDAEHTKDDDSWSAYKTKLDSGEVEKPAAREADLDALLRANIAKRAEQETDSKDFHESKEAREALEHRYSGRIKMGDMLDAFSGWHAAFQRNPTQTADSLAASYLQQTPLALAGLGPKPDQNEADPFKRVDAVHRDQSEFVATAKQRTMLKEMFPGLSFSDACRRLVQLDEDLHREPVGTSARLAASYGMPVTPGQMRIAESVPVANDIISQTAAHLPDFGELSDDIAKVLQHRGFKRSEDMQGDLLRAHRIAQLAREEMALQKAKTAKGEKPAPQKRQDLDGLIATAMAGVAA